MERVKFRHSLVRVHKTPGLRGHLSRAGILSLHHLQEEPHCCRDVHHHHQLTGEDHRRRPRLLASRSHQRVDSHEMYLKMRSLQRQPRLARAPLRDLRGHDLGLRTTAASSAALDLPWATSPATSSAERRTWQLMSDSRMRPSCSDNLIAFLTRDLAMSSVLMLSVSSIRTIVCILH